MRKEIKELKDGKALGFMATVSEKLSVKSAAEYESFKIKTANGLLKEAPEVNKE